jgi:predicted DNA-binding protein with PD1-like motif
MKCKRCGSKVIVRIDKGEEIVESLKQLCKSNAIRLGSISGIGATNGATIGLFETGTKRYLSKDLVGEYEIAHLSGNISTMNGEVYLHIHITLADSHYNAFGGHLNSAIVSGTCEVVIDVIDGEIDRDFSEEIGLNLYKI